MTKEDLAFIRALREQGVEVTFSKPDNTVPELQGGLIEDASNYLGDIGKTLSTTYDNVVDKFTDFSEVASNKQLNTDDFQINTDDFQTPVKEQLTPLPEPPNKGNTEEVKPVAAANGWVMGPRQAAVNNSDLVKKYGKGVNYRGNLLDLYDKRIGARSGKLTRHRIPGRSGAADIGDINDPELKMLYQEMSDLQNFMDNPDTDYSNWSDAYKDERYAKRKRLKELNSQFQNHPSNQIEFNNPETSWREIMANHPEIDNVPLFIASLFDEGGEQSGVYSSYDGAYSGFGLFGLDTVWDRFPEMRSNMVRRGAKNEKGEEVNTADFTDLNQVVNAKWKYMQAGKANVAKGESELDVKLSDAAKNFFTIVSYNMGEAGARKMMKSYHDKGILENDKFLTEKPSSYQQPWTFATRRMQIAKMLEGEGVFEPIETAELKQEGTIPELQGGEVEQKEVPYSPAITKGTNIHIYQDQLNRLYPDQKIKVDGKWGSETQALHERFKADKAKFKAEAEFRQDFREAMPLTGFGETFFPGATRTVTALADDIFRKQTGIGEDYPVRTEYDLTKDQNKVVKDLTRQNLAKGTSFISYPHYETVSPDKAYSNRTGIKTAKALLTDPAFQTQSMLGNASIVITPETFTSEPDTFLIDQYDFNERSYKHLSRDPDMTAGQKLLESFGQASGPYGVARNLAQYFGSDEGDPSSKQYIIQINEDTPELQGGLVEAKADNTAVNFVNPFLEQELYKQNQAIAAEELKRSKAENPGVIYETKLPRADEKLLNIAANPVQAFGYSVRGEDMPPGLLPNADTNIDAVLDMVNPFAWANYATEVGKSVEREDVLGAGLNLLGAVPGVKMPGVTLGAKTLVKPVVNKIQPIVKTGLDDMTDVLTTGAYRMKLDFGNLKFDVKNKYLPEKISADNVSNKAIKGQSVDGLGYDRFDQSLGGRVSKSSVDNELFRTSARAIGQKYFDPSVIDLLENLSNFGSVSKAVMLGHKLNLADLGQMRRFNTRPLDLTLGGEYTNFLNTQKLSPNFTASDELLADFYTRGYDKFFNSPTHPIRRDHMARALERNPGVRNPSPRELGLLWEGFDRFHKDLRGRLESSILKTKLNEPTSLFRLEGGDFPVTVRRNGQTYATNYSDMQVGDILLPDSRFKSTSYDKPAFFGTMGSVINAPAGQSVLVPNITGVRNYTNELEALLPPQLEFQVKQISDRLPYFEKGKLKNWMLEKSYAFDIVNPYEKGGVEKMKQGGMERQKFSKEDLAFMRALREQGVEVTFSKDGYRDDSPDRNNAVNVIDTKGTGRISMNNNDGTPIQGAQRILAITDRGQKKILESGNEYALNGDKVLEIPMAQSGMVENGVPLLQSGISNEQAISMANSGISQGYQDYTSNNLSNLDKAKAGSGSQGGSMEAGTGFGMSDAMAIGSGVANITQSLAQLGPESSTEVGSVSGMGGQREQAVEGTIGGVMSSIPVVGQFYQIGAGIGAGFEAGANAFYAEGNEAGGEAMTAIQGAINPSSQWGRNAELWEAGYLSDAQAVGNLFAPFIGGPMMDRKVRDIKSNRFTAQSARATGGLHTTPSPSAESAGKFSKATGYPKPKRT